GLEFACAFICVHLWFHVFLCPLLLQDSPGWIAALPLCVPCVRWGPAVFSRLSTSCFRDGVSLRIKASNHEILDSHRFISFLPAIAAVGRQRQRDSCGWRRRCANVSVPRRIGPRCRLCLSGRHLWS